jgi:hypothetical protein
LGLSMPAPSGRKNPGASSGKGIEIVPPEDSGTLGGCLIGEP